MNHFAIPADSLTCCFCSDVVTCVLFINLAVLINGIGGIKNEGYNCTIKWVDLYTAILYKSYQHDSTYDGGSV